MPRASREQMAENHERVLEEARRLIREKGADGVSVPEVMAAAGLTHGGFYKHFASKEALLAEAGAGAFAERSAVLDDLVDTDPATARARFVAQYLSTAHRDHPGEGCAGVALAADVARRGPDDPLHDTYVAGVTRLVDTLHTLRSGEAVGAVPTMPGAGRHDPEALAELATLVGAQVLARATAGDPISEQFLDAARARLLRE
ncbi:TetR/AcrR family transcriptional regulator [Actinomycetospora sp. CA-101289]|uniref:TetR/AcrR family transcriptional regulator n=1 Tax=Actinomycetospora sp. CA-101289 TaxID=3239893 RepID=UPI003D97016E